MRVTFVLPEYRAEPIGGYLVVFRYANELSGRGHHVHIVHAHRSDTAQGLIARSRSAYRYSRRRRHNPDGRPTWFDIDPRVEVRLVSDLRESGIPDGDAIFATACSTAPAVTGFGSSKGTKLYLVQGYEDWACGKSQVTATWRMPLHKVVSSQWLFDIGVELGETDRLTHISPGIELDVFRTRILPEGRSPVRVGMLAHDQPIKGLTYAIEALETVRAAVPRLEAVAFGAQGRPLTLPQWVDYIQSPTRPELASFFNSLAIFIHSSMSEGWPLPPAEAMACGCALVASDSGGVRDYAIDTETALVVPTHNASALAAATIELIQNTPQRLRLVTAGRRVVEGFTTAGAAERLEALLMKVTETP